MADNDPVEVIELERTADFRIKKLGENPNDVQSAAAAKLLQKLADDLRQSRGSKAYAEYTAILNWLGEFDVMEDFTEQAFAYRLRIGIDAFPQTGEAYLEALVKLAKEIAGT